jgi:hypothetical protein
MTDHKKPGMAFWATVAMVVVLIGYPLSFGPACWWFTKPLEVPIASYVTVRQTPVIYQPIGWLAQFVPDSFGRVINWYATVGAGDYAIICGFDPESGESLFWAGGYK